MRITASAAALLATLFCFACGSGDDTPPLDEMSLRDALLVEPSVILQLKQDARQHLRTRFTDARQQSDATTETTPQAGTPLFNQVAAMDAVRFGAGRDALLTGSWVMIGSTAQAVAMTDAVGQSPQNPLPPLQGDLSGNTILSEQRALEGAAGAVVEKLLLMTSSQRVERVVSWPIAALAAGGTVYVNAAWLATMDDHKTGCSGGGGSSNSGSGPAGAAGAAGQGGAYMYLVGGDVAQSGAEGSEASGSDGKSGVENSANATGFDLCSSSSCSSCNSSSSSCNSSSSSCSYCNDPTGDKACCRACAMSSVAPQTPLVAYGALFWLFLPFAFLLMCESRGKKLQRLLMRQRGGIKP